MVERAGIFGDTDFDLAGFAPAPPGPAVPPEAIRKVAEMAEFSSREPTRARPRREPRCHRTGRNAQLSIKADPEVIDEFYAITKAQDWVLGVTLERAVAALKRELAGGGGA